MLNKHHAKRQINFILIEMQDSKHKNKLYGIAKIIISKNQRSIIIKVILLLLLRHTQLLLHDALKL